MISEEFQQRLDLLLDGELSEEEALAFRHAVQDDPALRALVRDDLVLASALESVDPSVFAPPAVPLKLKKRPERLRLPCSSTKWPSSP